MPICLLQFAELLLIGLSLDFLATIRRGKLNSQFIVTARMDFQIFPINFRFQIQYSKYTVPWAAPVLISGRGSDDIELEHSHPSLSTSF